MSAGDNFVRCWVDEAIESVAKKGPAAPDRDFLLACYGLMTREILKKLESLRGPLWFAGTMVGGSAVAQVVLKMVWG